MKISQILPCTQSYRLVLDHAQFKEIGLSLVPIALRQLARYSSLSFDVSADEHAKDVAHANG